MQNISLNKTLEMNSVIEDLLLISIDEQIETSDDKDGIKVRGDIIINGKVKTEEGEKTFNDKIDLDIFLNYEEVVERNSLNVSVNDFNYKINENKLILNISLKLDGLKEIETTFLAEENIESLQEEIEGLKYIEEESELEINNDKKVYIDIDVEVNERNEEENIEKSNNEEITEQIKEETKPIEEINNEYLAKEIIVDAKEEPLVIKESKEPVKKSLLKSVFASRKIHEEVSWKLHCVKNENSYEEIASKYEVNLNKLISINNNEELKEGKLIFLPLE